MGLEKRTDDEGILWLVFTPEGRRPPLLTRAVLGDLRQAVEAAAVDPPIGVVFMAEPGGDFQAGVDLDELAAAGTEEAAYEGSRAGQLLFQAVADLAVPTVAAIEGRCVGGGTELALACDARLAAADPDTAMALPEIHLGLMPGFGGTQRLPRLIGQRRALNMILTGQAVRADRALRWGLVDRLVPTRELATEAVRTVRLLSERRWRTAGPRLWWRPWELIFEGTRIGRRLVRARYFRIIRKRTKGRYPAPETALEAVGAAADRMPLPQGLEQEARLFATLAEGPVHHHLLRLMRHRQALRRPRPDGAPPSGGVGGEEGAGTPLRVPYPVTQRLDAMMRASPGHGGGSAGTGELPLMEMPGGVGILRRLPVARPPLAAEVTWLPSAGSPAGFEESVRRLLASAGITPIWCYMAEPSPGLNLLAAYLREGDRLVTEGQAPTAVDRAMRDWGMSAGPFTLQNRMGADWKRRLHSLATRRPPEPTGRGTPPPAADAGAVTERMVDEIVAALALEMARLRDAVAEPVEAGWAVLDVFVLGAPTHLGGILGEARRRGEQSVSATLLGLRDRWGPLYDPMALRESGLLAQEGEPPSGSVQ